MLIFPFYICPMIPSIMPGGGRPIPIFSIIFSTMPFIAPPPIICCIMPCMPPAPPIAFIAHDICGSLYMAPCILLIISIGFILPDIMSARLKPIFPTISFIRLCSSLQLFNRLQVLATSALLNPPDARVAEFYQVI